MIHYLQARKKQREYIKTHTAKLKHAQTASQMKKTNKHSTTPVKPINDSDINEMMRRAPTVPVDDISLGLGEIQDFGERVGGLAWLGARFWLQLPGIQYMLAGSFLLFALLFNT